MNVLWPDFVNGAFEFAGSVAVWMNVRALYHDRQVKGVRIGVFVFFAAWGVWNLYYYPHLEQWASFAGGVSIVTANVVWVVLALRYGLCTRTTQQQYNPVHQDGPYWFFWDETWTAKYGPYSSKRRATVACREYGKWLNGQTYDGKKLVPQCPTKFTKSL